MPLFERLRQLSIDIDAAPPLIASRVITRWREGKCDLFCDERRIDPSNSTWDQLMIDGRTDADGQPQFRIRNGIDKRMSIGGLTMDNDLSYRPWEISVEAVAALQKELSTTTEQLIAEKIAAAIAELPVPKDGIDIETVRQLIDEALLASTKISQQRKPGPKARWRMFVAAEACDFYLKHRRDPTAKELIELCHDKIKDLLPEGRVLDESSVYQLLRYLGAE